MTDSRISSMPLWAPLLRLWRTFIDEPNLPLLDRWLKQQQRQGGGLQGLPVAEHLWLSAGLRQAVIFLQLASALEVAYRQRTWAHNWLEWDRQWSPDRVKSIPVAAFWGWIALRQGWDTGALRLADKAERRRFYAECEAAVADMASAAEIPPWYFLWYGLRPGWTGLLAERARLSDWSSEECRHFFYQQTQLPPLWLRPQQGVSAQVMADTLVKQGVSARLDLQGNLFAQGGRGLASTAAYQQGLVEIQDWASQQIAAAVQAQPGQKVWDCCAGAGGKTLAIAAPMENKGVLVATDLYAYKLEELKRRAKRAGLFNLRSFTWTGEQPLQLPQEIARQQGFDWVLVDAPCTASGTWRRNPDARWRFNPADTQELVDIQRRLLDLAAVSVRPGGHLVYATCSWQYAENEAQADAFCARHPAFEPVSQRLVGAPRQDSDTMFVAVFRRLFDDTK